MWKHVVILLWKVQFRNTRCLEDRAHMCSETKGGGMDGKLSQGGVVCFLIYCFQRFFSVICTKTHLRITVGPWSEGKLANSKIGHIDFKRERHKISIKAEGEAGKGNQITQSEKPKINLFQLLAAEIEKLHKKKKMQVPLTKNKVQVFWWNMKRVKFSHKNLKSILVNILM